MQGAPSKIRQSVMAPSIDLANILADGLAVRIQPEITQQFRAGDIRHCVADVTKSESVLGFKPQISIEDGVQDLIAWARHQTSVGVSEDAFAELEMRGLSRA